MKKHLGKLIAIFGLCVAISVALAGCGGDETESDKEAQSNLDNRDNPEITGTFDKETAQSFKIEGLTCYVPSTWTVNEEKNAEFPAQYEDKVYYIVQINKDSDEESYEDYVADIKEGFNVGDAYIQSRQIIGCDNATTFAFVNKSESENEYDKLSYLLLAERNDDRISLLITCSDPNYYDKREFYKILSACDFEGYGKPKETTTTTQTTTQTTTKPTTTKATTKANNGYSRSISNSEKQDITRAYVDLENEKVFSRSDYDYMSNETEEKLYDEIYETIESMYDVTEKDIMGILYNEGYLIDYRKNNY